MRSVRVSLVSAVLVLGGLLVVAAPAAQASFGIESFYAANCKTTTCTLKSTEEHPSEYFTQAAGHPEGGVTEFTLKTHVIQTVPFVAVAPEGNVKNIRTNVAPGVATSPEAVTKCPVASFTGKEVAPGFFTGPECPGSEIGEQHVTIVTKIPPGEPFEGDYANIELEGTLYNLEQPEGSGLASYFGVALSLAKAGHSGLYTHTFLEGHVEWGSESPEASKVESQGTGKADYHDYYVIKGVAEGLIKSRLVFFGTKGNTNKGGFVTNPSNCSGVGSQTTTGIRMESYEGEFANDSYQGPVGTEGCNGASPFSRVPFEPGFNLHPETSQSDKPDGITTELSVAHSPSPEAIDNSQVRNVSITLPEGMTINPSAAGEVTAACTPKQIGIGTRNAVECPTASRLGEVTLEVPTLPAESLKGYLYLGGPEGGGAITGQPYVVYLNAKSERYGVDVRVEGKVTANESTGQLTAKFENLPEQPFSNAIIKFKGGELAPIANPLTCGTASSGASLVPYTGNPASLSPAVSPFSVDSNGSGGACASPLPFTWSQSVVNQPPGYAGAKTSYTLNEQRSDGQQYVSQIKTVLPAGLVGLLPTVTRCGEAEANAGTCPGASQIGVVNVTAGSGKGYGFVGQVYLTGPYGGAPFGMSVVVPALAGPFNLGNVVTRGTIAIEPYTARVVATSTLPTIVKGIPLRIKGITVNINRQGFLQNPTNCGVLQTETTLTSTMGATQKISTPFQVNNCGALQFKPSFGSSTGAKTSKANGASLETTLNVPAGDANVKSATVQLPKQLPSRLTTLQKACPEATFYSNPYHCPSGSFVGGARANSPTLATKLTGPAILVSHGGRAFPDLDLLLEAEGVRVILVGNTNIKNGITTTTFAEDPDAPVTSITVNLPTGSHSALTANGNLCTSNLKMPTTVVSQNGITFKQNTTIKVKNCPVTVVGHKTAGDTAYLTVRTFEPGRVSGKGSDLATTFRKFSKAQKAASLKVSLSNAGRNRRRPFYAKVRVGFVPKAKGKSTSVTYVTVRFG